MHRWPSPTPTTKNSPSSDDPTPILLLALLQGGSLLLSLWASILFWPLRINVLLSLLQHFLNVGTHSVPVFFTRGHKSYDVVRSIVAYLVSSLFASHLVHSKKLTVSIVLRRVAIQARCALYFSIPSSPVK